jgi:hypothetical protein
MRASAVTTAPVADVMRRARDAFGQRGGGLRLADAGMLHASWRHESGFVNLTIEPGHRENTIVIETREFDAEVERFLRSLPRQSIVAQLLRRFSRSNR